MESARPRRVGARLDDVGTRSVWLRRTEAVVQKDVAMLERKNCMDPRDRWKLSWAWFLTRRRNVLDV